MSKSEETQANIEVKVSVCRKCTGWVRVAVEHRMTLKSKREFAIECFDNHLDIKTMLLTEFHKEDKPMCSC